MNKDYIMGNVYDGILNKNIAETFRANTVMRKNRASSAGPNFTAAALRGKRSEYKRRYRQTI
jgi:hypothetical protein